ncbi:MAG: DNA-directed polymerase [Myxococcales bacterium]|nr:DNA-directed polymerase [Myxococcales bacterium]
MRRNEYVTRHYPYVERVARGLARRLPTHIALDDLISSGAMGLIEAAERFDPKLGQNFEAFAEQRIRGAMLDDIRRRDTLSRDMRRLWSELRRTGDALAQQLRRAPNDGELAEHLGVSLDGLHARRLNLSGARVLTYDEVDPDVIHHQPDPAVDDPYSTTARREILGKLGPAIAALPERLQQVLSLYYGEELCLRQIGEVLGVTESRVCQLHTEAAKRLRKLLGDEDTAS